MVNYNEYELIGHESRPKYMKKIDKYKRNNLQATEKNSKSLLINNLTVSTPPQATVDTEVAKHRITLCQ